MRISTDASAVKEFNAEHTSCQGWTCTGKSLANGHSQDATERRLCYNQYMNRFPDTPRRIFPLIFISSLSSLAYEIALIRIFSITLWYHFAFMVISIAMLGIGASGTLLSVFPALKDLRRIPAYGLALAIGIPVSYLLANLVPFDPVRLSWDRLQVLYIGVYYLVFGVPFLAFGLIVSTAFSALKEYPGLVYASDLLGAGTGSLLVFCLLFLVGPDQAVFILSSLAAAGLLLSVRGWMRPVAGLVIALNVLMFALHPLISQPRMSPYKPLEVALRFPGAEHLRAYDSPYGRVDVFKSPAVRYAPGLSLRYLEPLPEQTGIAVDGGDIQAVTEEADPAKLSFLRNLPSSLPYLLAEKDDVLILEPKGGLAALSATYHGAKRVQGVESHPLVMRVVRELRGNRPAAPDEALYHAGLGRTWLSASARMFDVIDLSFMGSLPGASFGFAEDYRFTVEAFRIYLDHLKPGGFLSLNLYIVPPPRTELRLLATLAEAAERSGFPDVPSRIAAIRSWDTLTVLYKNGDLTDGDLDLIRRFCRERRFDTVYFPGITSSESNIFVKMRGNEYFEAFQRLILPAARQQFLENSLFDVRPVHDDGPFFHYYLKIGNIGDIYRVMGGKWQYFFEEGYLLPVLFGQVLVISVILIVLPLFAGRRPVPPNAGQGTLRALSYFAAIGLAFLFVEIVIIQKMVLVLEHPAYAAGTVIASVLAGSGAGSYASQRLEWLRRPRTLLITGGLCALTSVALPVLDPLLVVVSLPIRIFTVFLLFLFLGFFMGIPLPLGIALLHKSDPELVPWAWAVNGCFSVLSPILAVMLALAVGYSLVILMGAGLYVAGYLCIRQARNSLTRTERD